MNDHESWMTMIITIVVAVVMIHDNDKYFDMARDCELYQIWAVEVQLQLREFHFPRPCGDGWCFFHFATKLKDITLFHRWIIICFRSRWVVRPKGPLFPVKCSTCSTTRGFHRGFQVAPEVMGDSDKILAELGIEFVGRDARSREDLWPARHVWKYIEKWDNLSHRIHVCHIW